MGGYTPNYDTKRYLINASLIVCGIFTLIQSYGVKHPKLPFQLGAGVCSVMGVSFTSLPIGQVIIPSLRTDWYLQNPQCTAAMQSANCAITATCKVYPSAIPACQAICSAQAYQCQSDSFDFAWGQMVGTSCFCALVPLFISLLSFKRINQLFPPIVVGPTISASLVMYIAPWLALNFNPASAHWHCPHQCWHRLLGRRRVLRRQRHVRRRHEIRHGAHVIWRSDEQTGFAVVHQIQPV